MAPASSRRGHPDVPLTRAFLRSAFSQGRTLTDVASEVGCSPMTVRNRAIELGIAYGHQVRADLFAESVTRAAAAGRTVAEIAADAGCAPSKVRAALRRRGLPLPPPRRRASDAIPEAELRIAAATGKTIRAIATEYDVSTATVHRLLHRHGIQTRRALWRLDAALTEEFLVAALRAGRSASSVAAEVGCTRDTVAAHARRLGIAFPPPQPHYEVGALRAAVEAKTPISKIAAQVGVSKTTMRTILARHGLPRRYRPDAAGVLTAEFLGTAFRAGRAVQDIAAECGVSSPTVYFYARRHGLPPPTRPDGPVCGPRTNHDPGREWLYDAYVTQRRRVVDIAVDLGLNQAMVYRYLRKHDVRR